MSSQRGVFVAVVLGIFFGLATAASAGHWFTASGWHHNIYHLPGGHNPVYGFFNAADEDGEVRLRYDESRGHWSTWPLTLANVGDIHAGHIRAFDGHYGATGWVGLAQGQGAVYVHGGWHPQYFEIHANLDYMQYPGWTDVWQYKQGVTCHEIGHAVAGVTDQTGPDASCMAMGYTATNGEWLTDYRFILPSPHDREHIGHLWSALH